jgi:hypothetical protein
MFERSAPSLELKKPFDFLLHLSWRYGHRERTLLLKDEQLRVLDDDDVADEADHPLEKCRAASLENFDP